MQRAEVLLQKLNEQILSNASASHILVTLQLLHREYLQKAETEIPIESSISVVLPFANTISNLISNEQIQESLISLNELSHNNDQVVEVSIETITIKSFHEEEKLDANPLIEVNDQLKSGSSDIVEFLSDVPIKELRKAIGINDRYLFINELFNGDEAMFERSLKTLDQFVLLHDAESWIRRELSVKMGWKEDNPTVRQFGLLLKRRFS